MAVMDLYSLFVLEGMGSAIGAVVVLSLIFFLYGMFMRMGTILITSICALYFMIIFTFFYGGVIGVLIFTGSALFFISSILPWTSGKLNQ